MNGPVNRHPHKVIGCREYDVLIPFVCHQCGNCCRKYEPTIEPELLPEIAYCLGEAIAAIEKRLRDNSLSHRDGRPTDCCFLDPLHLRCSIYSVRPTSCRQFPALHGDDSAGAVDCPGYREYRRVLNAFIGYLDEAPRGAVTAARRRRRITPPDARGDMQHTLTNAQVSGKYRQVFEEMNDQDLFLEPRHF